MPLVIDLGPTSAEAGDGLAFINRLSSSVFYDFDKDSYKERTAWVGPHEGIVIWDKDKDGKVDAGEMILSGYEAGAKSDMDALIKAGFDKDGDGKIEASEADGGSGDIGRLLIWQDKNSNGVSDSGDVVSSFGSIVSSIDISGADIDAQDKDKDGRIDLDETVRFIDGSKLFGTYKVALVNGEETTAYDMAFAYDDYGYKVDGEDIILEGLVTRKTRIVSADSSYVLNDSGDYYGAKGSSGNETITVSTSGSSGARNYSIDGEAGNDTLTGGEGDDYIVGGAGVDKINGGRGNDVLFVDGADTTVNGGLGYDVAIVEGDDGRTIDLGTAEIEAYIGSDGGADVVTSEPNRDVYISGRGGNDTLGGSDGDDTILGGTGNDTLRGEAGNDYMVGGTGADNLWGHEGDDIIVMDKSDNIVDGKVNGGSGDDLLIYEGSDEKNLVLELGDYGFESAVGSEGADELRLRYTNADGDLVRNLTAGILVGRGGNDTLSGSQGDDVLSGDAGNDVLAGHQGNDLYLYGRGGGSDRFMELGDGVGGRDTVSFGADIFADQLTFSIVDGDLKIAISGADGGTITVQDWTDITGDKQIELLALADGTILDIANAKITTLTSEDNVYAATAGSLTVPMIIQGLGGNDEITADSGNDIIIAGSGGDTVRGGSGHDYINGGMHTDSLYGDAGDDTLIGDGTTGGGFTDYLYGGTGDDWIEGRGGNDTVNGDAGDDTLMGGDGSDTLNGSSGDDILLGGKGTDVLTGGAGDDSYFYLRGDGADTISDVQSDDDIDSSDLASGENRIGDRLFFGRGIELDDLAFDLDGEDLIVGVTVDGDVDTAPAAMADRVRIKNWSSTEKRIESFLFSDGLILDVRDMDNAWTGTNAGDSEHDGENDSFLTGGYGADTIRGGDGDDVIVGGDGNDTLLGWGNHDAIFGGDGNDSIEGNEGNDRLFGGAGNDTIDGEAEAGTGTGKNVIAGGAGNDTLTGGAGTDQFLFGWGDGNDTLTERLGGGVDYIDFSAGVWLSDLQMKRSGNTFVLTLNAAPFGQSSKDTITIKDDMNTTDPRHAVEVLRFANGYGVDFADIQSGFVGDEDANSVNRSTSTEGVWATGYAGNDTLKTGSSTDVLIGGRNDDRLEGGAGNDIYVFNAGDGRDVINDESGSSNSIVLGPGITHNDIFLQTTDGDMYVVLNDTRVVDGAIADFSDYIKIEGWNGDGGRRSIKWIEFADGTSVKLSNYASASYLSSGDDTSNASDSSQWIDGGTGNDTINGNGGEDRVYGKSGNDLLDGGAGEDWLEGGTGNDTLRGADDDDVLNGGDGHDELWGADGNDAVYGGDGDDTVGGGSGADELAGGLGNDTIYRGGQGEIDGATKGTTILFAAGDGDDVLKLSSGQSGSRDVISVSGYGVDQFWFQKTGGDDLTIRFLESGDSIRVEDFFDGGSHLFQKIQVGKRYLNDEKIANLVTTMSAYDPNDGTDGIGITASTLPSSVKSAIESAWLFSS